MGWLLDAMPWLWPGTGQAMRPRLDEMHDDIVQVAVFASEFFETLAQLINAGFVHRPAMLFSAEGIITRDDRKMESRRC
jgi:hypothetical protein